MQLHEDQRTAIASLKRCMVERQCRRVLLVAPCGWGKGTTIASMIDSAVRGKGSHVLFLVAGKQLVSEFSERVEEQFGLDHGVVMAGHPRQRPALPLQIASIDTLRSRLRRGLPLPRAELVIVDEADQARAERFESVLACYPDAFVIGQTATPCRADGKGLGDLFGEMVVAATLREMIEAGRLVDYSGWALESISTSGLRTSAGDYDMEQLDERLRGAEGEKLAGNVVGEWAKLAGGRRTVLFAVSIRHSQQLAKRFSDERVHGAPVAHAEHMDGTTPRELRREIFARVRSGETQVVSNVGVITRGVDCPPLEVVQWARPTKSLALYLQMAGRVFRLSPETGKKAALFLDHAGNVERHGFPCDERAWSLEDGAGKVTAAGLSATRCVQCLALFASRLRACPQCGWERPAPGEGGESRSLLTEDPQARAVSMEELRKRRFEEEKQKRAEETKDRKAIVLSEKERRMLERLVRVSELQHWKPKAVELRFKGMFGFWPPSRELAELSDPSKRVA